MGTNVLLKWLLLLVCVSGIANKEIDLAFLLDNWTNPGEEEPTKNFIEKIYDGLSNGNSTVYIALITSGRTSKIEFDFNLYQDPESLDDILDGLAFSKEPSTGLGKALNLANYGLFRNSARPNAVKILLVLANNKLSDDVNKASRDLLKTGVNILTAGIGNGLYQNDLYGIASPPMQYNTFVGDYNSLESLSTAIVKRVEYIAAASPAVSSSLEVKVQDDTKPVAQCSKKCEKIINGEAVPINCNNCKLAGCCGICCDKDEHRPFYSGPIELVFLLDESGELTNWNNFETLKSFLKSLTRNFDTSDKRSKLGIVSFSRDNVQIHDLRSYHEPAKLDSQIDKLYYDGSKVHPAKLKKGLDLTQTSLFSEPRGSSVPRVLLVFDSGTLKDEETEVQAFKLEASDIQTFCIGLGSSYNKAQCKKIVDEPAEKHSLSAQVGQLNDLRQTLTLMIVNDIAEKYCPFCSKDTEDSCRPCKTAKQYMGNDKGLQGIKPSQLLKIIKTYDKERKQSALSKLKSKHHDKDNDDDDDDDDEKKDDDDDDDDDYNVDEADDDDDDNDDNPGTQGLVSQDVNGQVGTSVPNVDAVKNLLQSSITAQPAQTTVLDSSQLGTIQQSPLLQQQSLSNPLVQQLPTVIDQKSLMRNQDSSALNTPSLATSSQSSLLPSPTLKPDGALAQLSNKPAGIDQSLLNQAVLGTGKFQRRRKGNPERKQVNPGSPLGRANQGPDSAPPDDMTSFQAGPLNPGITSSMPILPLPLRHQTDVQDSIPQQFQSLLPPKMRAPTMNNQPSRETSLENKEMGFGDEYKYDRFDQETSNIGCRDLSDECESYATEGGCEEYSPLTPFGNTQVMCKKSCGLCNPNTEKAKKKSRTKEIKTHAYKKSQ